MGSSLKTQSKAKFSPGSPSKPYFLFCFFHFPPVLFDLSNSPNPKNLWQCHTTASGMDLEQKALFSLQEDNGGLSSAFHFSKTLRSLHLPFQPHRAPHVPPQSFLISWYSDSSHLSFCQASLLWLPPSRSQTLHPA